MVCKSMTFFCKHLRTCGTPFTLDAGFSCSHKGPNLKGICPGRQVLIPWDYLHGTSK